MNSKLLLVIVGLIVVFGAFTFLASKSTNPTTSTKQPESTKSQETTPAVTETNNQVTNVILGDSGFVPKDIAVKQSTTVIWINKSGKAATVNSVDHPTHQLYPFLNLGEFPNSSSLQVVFDKAGKYGYHNHNNASQIGTVTVE
jgi:plastocyanin